MRWIDQLGTTNACSAVSASGPPSRPVNAIVSAADPANHVGRGARRRDAEHGVGGGERRQLRGEHVGEVAVVGERGQQGRVGDQRAGRQRAALLDDRMRELDGHVHRVAGRAAVAHHVEAAAPAKPRRERLRGGLEPLRARREEAGRELGGLGDLAQDGVLHAGLLCA
jgi:hypothetical protein